MEYLLLILAVVILYFGAEWLVNGASSLAARLGVSPLIIGLTVVSFGTSAPELLVSVEAAMQGQSALAVGNVVGSNLFNIVLILGISAIVYPLMVQKQLLKFDVPVMIGVTGLFAVLFLDGALSRIEAFVFLLLFVVYISVLTVKSIRERRNNSEGVADMHEGIKIYPHWFIDLAMFAMGLVALVYGSGMLVKNSIVIARNFGVSEAIIGLTIVAAGTSVPELATSVVAAIKKQSDIAIGNVVGSNIFNILLILGAAGAIRPIETPDISIKDNLFMLGISFLLLLFMAIGSKIKRWQGVVFVLFYAAYMYLKLTRMI